MTSENELDMSICEKVAAYSAISYMDEAYCNDNAQDIPEPMLACRSYGAAAREAAETLLSREQTGNEYATAWEKGGSISVAAAHMASNDAHFDAIVENADITAARVIMSLTSRAVRSKSPLDDLDYNEVVIVAALYAVKRMAKDMSLIIVNEAITRATYHAAEDFHTTIARVDEFIETDMNDVVRGIDVDYLRMGYHDALEAIQYVTCDDYISDEWRKEAIHRFKDQPEVSWEEMGDANERLNDEVGNRLYCDMPSEKIAEYSAWRVAIDTYGYSPDEIRIIQFVGAQPSFIDCMIL